MANTKDGGPAFPRPFSDNGGDTYERMENAQEGMSLRDYFAAHALAVIPGDASDAHGIKDLAADAYQIADAMLAERAKGKV
jgi:hypothetical protein